MNTKTLKVNDSIGFTLPYFEGKLKFTGEVLKIKSKTVEVKYETCLGENEPYKINVLKTEIPFSFILIDK